MVQTSKEKKTNQEAMEGRAEQNVPWGLGVGMHASV